MKLEGEYVFDGPREKVWEILRDPEMLAKALPGTKSLEKLSETEFEGKMHLRIGAVSGVFAGRVVISDEVPPERCTLVVDGRGAPGFARGEGRVHLTEQGKDETLMEYDGELQVGGRLAGVGQRLMESVSKSILRQGLEALNATLKPVPDEIAAEPEALAEQTHVATAPLEVAAPSETQFAATVARDVVKDLAGDWITQESLSIWATGIVAIVAILVGFWLGRTSCRD